MKDVKTLIVGVQRDDDITLFILVCSFKWYAENILPLSLCLHTTAGKRLADRNEAHFSSSASEIKAGTSNSEG